MHLHLDVDSPFLPESETAAQAQSTGYAIQNDRPTPETVRKLKERIEAAFSGSLDRFGATCFRTARETEDLVAAARELAAAGGKRIRPRLVYWGWRAAGRPDCDEIIELAVAVEVFHLFTLVHDDVMDLSDSRRGVLTAHRQLATTHQARGWRGDAEHFGMSAGILLGDALMVWSDAMINASPLLAEDPMPFRRAYDEMRLELIGGQYLDITADCVNSTSLTAALRLARLKSGNYSIAHPLRLGAIAGGADQEIICGLGEFGSLLGEAFQIHDDILGMFGAPGKTGKPVGDDLRQGKRTTLAALALAQAVPAAAHQLREMLGNPDLTPQQVEVARNIITESGALEGARALMADRVTDAQRKLAAMPIDALAKQSLQGLVTEVSDGTRR